MFLNEYASCGGKYTRILSCGNGMAGTTAQILFSLAAIITGYLSDRNRPESHSGSSEESNSLSELFDVMTGHGFHSQYV